MTVARRRPLLVAALGLATLVAAVTAWRWSRERAPAGPEGGPGGPPADPRLTFSTPYRNVRPEVAYVGSAACTGCHRAIATHFRHHPMGRSSLAGSELVADRIGLFPSGREPLSGLAALASRRVPVERYVRAAHDPFTSSGIEYCVQPRGGEIIHRETIYDPLRQVVASCEAPVALAIGSGTRGRTYVIRRGDTLTESPISWYSVESRWDLSPGYPAGQVHFERPVTAACLYCHTNAVEPVEGTVNSYRPPLVRGHAIGCERCHGPGELHVASRKRGETFEGPDPTIVNPADLEPALRESVCEQCHLQGLAVVPRAGRQPFDFRPGLPYRLFWSVFVSPEELADRRQSVRTVEQMHASKCYQKSGGALGCISCHDPHELPAPEDKVAYYRDRCLRCHESPAQRPGGGRPAHAPGCTEAEPPRRANGDNCIACHMAPLRSSDVAHLANTDHRVPRRPYSVTGAPGRTPTRSTGRLPLVYFHRDQADPDDRGLARDLGIALVQFASEHRDTALAARALPLLEGALGDWPDDVAALEAKGTALGMTGHGEDGLAAYEAALTRAPRQEALLLRAGEVTEVMGQSDKAAEYYGRALAVNPHRAAPHTGLGRVLAGRRQWQRASQELEAGLRLQPFDTRARQILIICYLRTGRREEARAGYQTLLGFPLPNRQAVIDWYGRQTRTAPK